MKFIYTAALIMTLGFWPTDDNKAPKQTVGAGTRVTQVELPRSL